MYLARKFKTVLWFIPWLDWRLSYGWKYGLIKYYRWAGGPHLEGGCRRFDGPSRPHPFPPSRLNAQATETSVWKVNVESFRCLCCPDRARLSWWRRRGTLGRRHASSSLLSISWLMIDTLIPSHVFLPKFMQPFSRLHWKYTAAPDNCIAMSTVGLSLQRQAHDNFVVWNGRTMSSSRNDTCKWTRALVQAYASKEMLICLGWKIP